VATEGCWFEEPSAEFRKKCIEEYVKIRSNMSLSSSTDHPAKNRKNIASNHIMFMLSDELSWLMYLQMSMNPDMCKLFVTKMDKACKNIKAEAIKEYEASL
jgi:hypothetical protein